MSDDDSGVHVYGEIKAPMGCDEFAEALTSSGLKVEAGDYAVRLWIRGEPHEFELVENGFLYGAGPGHAAFRADVEDISKALAKLDIKHQFEMIDGDTGKRVARLHYDWPKV